MSEQLRERLRELADASKGEQPSATVEARLLEAFEEFHVTAPLNVPARVLRAPSIAASVLLAAAVTFLVAQTWPPQRAATVSGASTRPTDPLDGFVLLPGAELLPQLESGSIVRFELPVGTLPAYGIDIMPGIARTAVEADLLIGQDGHARAIRLVSTPGADRSTP